jgi:uncharacterized membrane protein YeaQ/YmgE (transglycosylase-associated protein family)
VNSADVIEDVIDLTGAAIAGWIGYNYFVSENAQTSNGLMFAVIGSMISVVALEWLWPGD